MCVATGFMKVALGSQKQSQMCAATGGFMKVTRGFKKADLSGSVLDAAFRELLWALIHQAEASSLAIASQISPLVACNV